LHTPYGETPSFRESDEARARCGRQIVAKQNDDFIRIDAGELLREARGVGRRP
jgi:hypothetical protein